MGWDKLFLGEEISVISALVSRIRVVGFFHRLSTSRVRQSPGIRVNTVPEPCIDFF